MDKALRDLPGFILRSLFGVVILALVFWLGFTVAHAYDARVPDLTFPALLSLAVPTASLIQSLKEGRW
jgi:hypothetical protein